MDDNSRTIEISGRVNAVIYSNEENGYTVLRLDVGDGEQVTAVGCLPFAAPGETMTFVGEWTKHPTHGEQFKVDSARRELPVSEEAIFEYLSSRAIKGIGPATALLIMSRFGTSSLDVIENHPEKLSELRGISRKKAEEISLHFKKQVGLRRLLEFLDRYGIAPRLAMKLYACYGDEALELLRENPYILAAEQIGGSFAEADELAIDLGLDADSPNRVIAAVVYVLRHNTGNGHVFIPRGKLCAAVCGLIDVETEAVEEAIDALSDAGELVVEPLADISACYLAKLHEAECYCAGRLLDMAGVVFDEKLDADRLIADFEKRMSISCAPMQRRILELAATRQLLAVTGGPGTGKTTSLRAVLDLYDRLGIDAALAAPTGRAAKRMSELSGREASTVHRLLEAGFSEDGAEVIFRRDESNPLKCGAIILDECSMVDITLMEALLRAMPLRCRLVMVGDADQLPSVGPGNVLSDVIRSGVVQTVRLTDVFRQAASSKIICNAHYINRGEHFSLGENSGDFFFLKRADHARALDTIVELCAARLPKNMGIPAQEIQVLSPTRKNELGTASINKRLQQALNPPGKDKREKPFGEVVFREGDRVMQIRNDYDIIWATADRTLSGAGVYNGDVGYIRAIDAATETMTVDYDGRLADYGFEQLNELEHAWAMTVHKSQGSEYRAVILCAGRGAPQLQTRGVLYTAVTRARELLVIVGENNVVDAMIDNVKRQNRYSGLRLRLRGGVA